MLGTALDDTGIELSQADALSVEMGELILQMEMLDLEMDEALKSEDWEQVSLILKATGVVISQLVELNGKCLEEMKKHVESIKNFAFTNCSDDDFLAACEKLLSEDQT